MRDGQSQAGPATTNVPANVNMATVGVDDFTASVTLTVTSLAARNDTCFASEAGE